MYPSTSLFVAIGQLAVVVLVMLSYPLQVLPCRNCLDKVFHAGSVHLPKPVAQGEEDDEEVEDEHTPVEMSRMKHLLLTAAIVGFGFMIAFLVDDLRIGELDEIFHIHLYSTRFYSTFICWIDWFNNHIFHSSWFVLLEGKS